jgi:hypothetical protein
LHNLFFVVSSLAFLVGAVARADTNGPECLPRNTLPFYQPRVDSQAVDTVVVDAQPAPNRFRVLTDFMGVGGEATPLTWDVGAQTGFRPSGDWGNFQRGKVNSAGYSGVQVQNDSVGLWLNSTDPEGIFHFGQASIQFGCWNTAAPAFPGPNAQLETTLEVAVPHDETTGEARAFTYVLFNLYDEKSCSGEAGCQQFLLSIGLYDKTPGG